MNKDAVVKTFQSGHRKMAEVISRLDNKQKTEENVVGNWTVKDILAHLSAWAIEATKEVDRVLQNNPTWPSLYFKEKGENDFNQREVLKRRKWSLDKVMREWKESFQLEIARVRKLTDKEWNHQSNQDKWGDGAPVTVASLYGYEYLGENHEGAHARQIKEHFKL